jgi:hypothetical protein
MTWNDTHERTRIFHEVEAAAAADMSGALPWRSEWSAYFNGPDGLLAALRARWERMLEAQLDARTSEDEFADTYTRLRRSQVGVLEILRGAEKHASRILELTGPRPASPTYRKTRFHRGPILPTAQ